ncbi:heterokaryon incompatibility protein-domain-containing protein [Clohesyomyces aquaticus]|uniref:Heterokaryon incompatibility protein-domain-containing protein n=1 Tax=Clohesyomyces aquaticus TaxID=1231657 RepID=A0A1Y1YPY5_9PLEO|nr:heterokaryon incompatibility protein-domain-containing protein [Clohesyomyces aquaticus]
MPLPKSLRQPKKQSLAQSTRRKPCRLCHNLNPRGHPNSNHPTESSKDDAASLTLVLDALSLQRTRAPTDGGCRFCGVLIHALDHFFEGWRECRERITVDIREKRSIKVELDGEKWKSELIEIYAGSAARSPWPTLGTAHHIPSNSGSDDTFDFARRCIQDCITNPKHTACKSSSYLPRSSLSSHHPKRLLDVGRVTSPIHLIDTSGKTFQYATLSHCWGSGPVLTATKSNWRKLASNIPFERLPPLFQDAVIITRQLGLRYIWIDSLCIIQDSTRDWETESAKMGGIYSQSYVTISATQSGDGNSKCLVDRQMPVRIDYQNTNGKEFALRARKIVDHHPDVDSSTPAKPIGPLATRAWVLQEHALSTRVLHYTSTELLFECKTSYRCECLPSRKAYPTTPALIPKAIAKRGEGDEAIWDAWHRIVEMYSKRNLTVPSDMLPALSGIASHIKDATRSNYLAGIWKDNIASDLLWFANMPGGSTVQALSTYRAPTFSWASLHVPVSYYTPDPDERASFKSTITLVSSHTSNAGLNHLGGVTNASIKVRGDCLTALLSSSQGETGWEYTLLVKGTSSIRISHDCALSVANASTGEIVRRAGPGEDLSAFKVDVLCLSVARYDSWMSGLVLGKSQRTDGAWERLGTFSAGYEGFGNAKATEVTIV